MFHEDRIVTMIRTGFSQKQLLLELEEVPEFYKSMSHANLQLQKRESNRKEKFQAILLILNITPSSYARYLIYIHLWKPNIAIYFITIKYLT